MHSEFTVTSLFSKKFLRAESRRAAVSGLMIMCFLACAPVCPAQTSGDPAEKVVSAGNPDVYGEDYGPARLPAGVIPAVKPLPFPRNQKIRIVEPAVSPVGAAKPVSLAAPLAAELPAKAVAVSLPIAVRKVDLIKPSPDS